MPSGDKRQQQACQCNFDGSIGVHAYSVLPLNGVVEKSVTDDSRPLHSRELRSIIGHRISIPAQLASLVSLVARECSLRATIASSAFGPSLTVFPFVRIRRVFTIGPLALLGFRWSLASLGVRRSLPATALRKGFHLSGSHEQQRHCQTQEQFPRQTFHLFSLSCLIEHTTAPEANSSLISINGFADR